MSSLPLVARGAGHRRHNCRRSRNGCLTCKRRKVRCNEQRPKCYHCQRLNLECLWKDAGTQRPSPLKNPPEPSTSNLDAEGPSPSTDLIDFVQSMTDPTQDFTLLQDIYLPDFGDFTAPGHSNERMLWTDLEGPNSNSPVPPPQSTPHSPPQSPTGNNNVEVEESLPLLVPPILDPVENGPKCASVRALFNSMATSSSMVRYSIAAFAAIQFYTTGKKTDYRQYYDKAANELSERFQKSEGNMTANSNELRYVLTTIFFLTYINVCHY